MSSRPHGRVRTPGPRASARPRPPRAWEGRGWGHRGRVGWHPLEGQAQRGALARDGEIREERAGEGKAYVVCRSLACHPLRRRSQASPRPAAPPSLPSSREGWRHSLSRCASRPRSRSTSSPQLPTRCSHVARSCAQSRRTTPRHESAASSPTIAREAAPSEGVPPPLPPPPPTPPPPPSAASSLPAASPPAPARSRRSSNGESDSLSDSMRRQAGLRPRTAGLHESSEPGVTEWRNREDAETPPPSPPPSPSLSLSLEMTKRDMPGEDRPSAGRRRRHGVALGGARPMLFS